MNGSYLGPKFDNLFVEKKYLHPKVPKNINKHRVFTLPLPNKIATHVTQGEEQQIFDVSYDEIICDDIHINERGILNVKRYNTIKEGNKMYSTFKIRVHALKKIKREEIELVDKYEISTTLNGKGRIEVSPSKEYYDYGDEVSIKAIPARSFKFRGWGKDLEEQHENPVSLIITSDVEVEANFEKIKETTKSIAEATKKFFDESNYKEENLSRAWYEPRKKPPLSQWVFMDVWNAIGEVIAYLIWGLTALAILYLLFSIFGWWILLIPLVFGVIWLSSRTAIIGKIIRLIFSMMKYGFYLLLFFSLLNIFLESNPFSAIESKVTENIATIRKEKENKTTDYVHHLSWQDYEGDKYKTTLVVNSDNVQYENAIKSQIPNVDTKKQYDLLLSKLSNVSEESLLKVYDSLNQLIASKELVGIKKAEVLVSMIQSLPYFVLIDKSCNPLSYSDRQIRTLLTSSPCLPDIKHGIQSPAEFLSNLKGDCDTRTLFLYKILKHFDFDVIILGSEYYKHSILGIHLPNTVYTGITYNYKGKEYHVWETTAPQMKIGELPFSLSDMKNWSVNLN